MPFRIRAGSLALSILASLVVTVAPTPLPAQAAGEKVAIIVGPVGSLTGSYRNSADRVANAATAAGANVVKVYSPNATWANVKAAVNGANIVVYFGHGNGYPNPYGSNELTDRTNGWGLNTGTMSGDADSWSNGTLVYCGEKAFLGTLTAGDGAAQRTHCSGGPLTPAAGFTMVYAQAHYAPGFGERYVQTTPQTTISEAQARVRNYSYPVLALGAGAFIATAYSDADAIVGRVLAQPGTSYAEIFALGRGYSPSTLNVAAHPDIAGAQTWVQRTIISGFHFGEPDYWYAFAGDPQRTPAGGQGAPLPFSDISGSPFQADIQWLVDQGITSGCGGGRFCPRAVVTRDQMASFIARALGLPAAGTDYFGDDNGSIHEADINRVAAAGITNGCAAGLYCPGAQVRRDQMASFLARALALPATGTNFFGDDAGNQHEPDINRVAAAGVTNGCGPGAYCPQGSVTREQMAAFLHRAIGS